MSDADDRFASSVRFWTEHGGIAGVGFVVGHRHVMTCAHVVADSLLDRNLALEPKPPTGNVVLDFLPAAGDRKTANVVAWRPRAGPRSAPHAAEDVAVLKLTRNCRVPAGVSAIKVGFGIDAGDEVRAFGVSTANPGGVAVTGEIVERLEGRWAFQSTHVDGAVEHGCSGAAVWAPVRGGVVGMIIEMQQQLTGLFLPLSELQEVWTLPLPEIPDFVRASRKCLTLLNEVFDANQRIISRGRTSEGVWSQMLNDTYNRVCCACERRRFGTEPPDSYFDAICGDPDMTTVCVKRWLLGEALDDYRAQLSKISAPPKPHVSLELAIRRCVTQPNCAPEELHAGLLRAIHEARTNELPTRPQPDPAVRKR